MTRDALVDTTKRAGGALGQAALFVVAIRVVDFALDAATDYLRRRREARAPE